MSDVAPGGLPGLYWNFLVNVLPALIHTCQLQDNLAYKNPIFWGVKTTPDFLIKVGEIISLPEQYKIRLQFVWGTWDTAW